MVSNHTPASLLTRQGAAVYYEGQWITDQSRFEVEAEHPCSRDELAQQLFKIEDLLWPGTARPRRPLMLGSQQRSRPSDAFRRPLERLFDLRSERQLEVGAAFVTLLSISPNSRMLDSGRIVTPIA